MAAKLLEGRPLAAKIKEDLKNQVDSLKSKKGRQPKLVALQAGENPASAVYIKSQKNVAESLGIEYELKTLPGSVSEQGFLSEIDSLNRNSSVTGIIIQLPLPKQINHKTAMSRLDPAKDAEGMHPSNLGKVLLGEYSMAPCTASACMELIKSTGIKLYGAEAVIVGHSEIVGKPLSLMLLKEFATTSVCHIGTGERGLVPAHVKGAEILVVAVGKAGLIKGEWVKEGAIVIDVGINKVGDKLVGDVGFDEAEKRASYITPVPGGVGPLTVTMLMRNIVEAFKA